MLRRMPIDGSENNSDNEQVLHGIKRYKIIWLMTLQDLFPEEYTKIGE